MTFRFVRAGSDAPGTSHEETVGGSPSLNGLLDIFDRLPGG
jgi:hypothetical protein